jgi:uncharacterized membrane protein YhiD involved in acid resistance
MSSLRGGHLIAYYVLLFLFLILNRALLAEFDARFDLTGFPKLAAGIEQALDNAGEFDIILTTIYSLMYAFLFSLPVAIVYRVTEDERQFDPHLGQTIVLLAMVVSAVITVIAGDLARAFGLAGVVAAVRFRNSLDDPKDAVYVFLAIAIGMACGARIYTIALCTSLLMTATLYLMWHYHFGQLPGRILASREGGKREKALLPPPSAGARSRVDQSIEQQYRLARMAEASAEPGERRSNVGLVIQARQLAPAESHVKRVCGLSGGQWRLVNIIAHEVEGFTLEFVGRLPKDAEPSSLFQALLAGKNAASIKTIEFLSLKRRDQRSLEEEERSPEAQSAAASIQPPEA